jgi:DNA-binding SARP family transcriptional activator
LRIFTLGRFAVLSHGKKLATKLLARNKPIQLLQALIALGGRQVSKTRLADIFWPDSNGDEQAAALKITLHRLRSMLGVAEVIIQTPTNLSLNPSVCWVDCWQFERQARAVLDRTGVDGGQEGQEAVLSVRTYQGDFLAAYMDDPWLFAYRERLKRLHERLLPLAARQ